MLDDDIVCPGCGLRLLGRKGGYDPQFNASCACRKLYFQLSVFTLQEHDSYFIHQLAVDAYTAQHSGENTKPIGTAFALIGLYLVFEKGYSGKEVQAVHILLGKRSKVWPHFLRPAEKADFTVKDVVNCPDNLKNKMIKKWAESVWSIWKADYKMVEKLVARP